MSRYKHLIDLAYSRLLQSDISVDIKKSAEIAFDNCKVSDSNRMTTAAGQCNWAVAKSYGNVVIVDLGIKFSDKLMARQDETGRYNTASHEFAHAVELIHTGSSDHGILWKRIHRAMGGNSKRCHTIDNRDLRRTRVRWRISIDGHPFTVTTQKKNKYSQGVYYSRSTRMPAVVKVLAKMEYDGYGKLVKETPLC